MTHEFEKLSKSLNTNFDAHLPVKSGKEITVSQTGEEKVEDKRR